MAVGVLFLLLRRNIRIDHLGFSPCHSQKYQYANRYPNFISDATCILKGMELVEVK